MMNKTLFIAFMMLISTAFTQKSHKIEEIGKFNLITQPIKNVTIYYPTEFILNNNREIAKVYSLDLIELIEEKIKKIKDVDSRNMGLLIEDKNGNLSLVSISEILQDISVIPPMIIFDKVRGSLGDTVKVQDFGMGDLDLSAIDDELSAAIQKKIHLQMASIPEEARIKFFETISIVFPTDKSTQRWIHDVVEIKLIKIT